MVDGYIGGRWIYWWLVEKLAVDGYIGGRWKNWW